MERYGGLGSGKRTRVLLTGEEEAIQAVSTRAISKRRRTRGIERIFQGRKTGGVFLTVFAGTDWFGKK